MRVACRHLLWKCGGVDGKEVERVAREAADAVEPERRWSWLLDTLGSERHGGRTIENNIKRFETAAYEWTATDTPGLRRFVHNAIPGVVAADVAVLVVPAPPSEFDAGMEPMGMTRQAALIVRALGVPHILVCVNKMDHCDVGHSEARFTDIKIAVSALLVNAGYRAAAVRFVPTAGATGANLSDRCDEMPWYRGPCVVDALDGFRVPARPVTRPLRLPVQSVCAVTGVGTVAVVTVASGTLSAEAVKGAGVVILPEGVRADVRSVHVHHRDAGEAGPGESVGLALTVRESGCGVWARLLPRRVLARVGV